MRARTAGVTRGLRWAVLAALCALALAACSESQRYEVLTVFFTGVPRPGQEQAEAAAAAGAGQAATPRRREAESFVHGPYGAGSCTLCHNLKGTVSFRTKRRQGQQPAAQQSSIPRGFGQRLAYPLEELCIGCHQDFDPKETEAAGDWSHGPVSAGRCIECHSPHRSPQRFMLKARPQALCLQCHEGKSPEATRARGEWSHGPVASGLCTGCHRPHRSPERFLLEEPGERLCLECHQRLGPEAAAARGDWQHGPVANGQCVRCHQPHGSQRRFLLAAPPAELCLGCHAEKGPAAARRQGLWLHGPVATGPCTTCHQPHGGPRPAFIKAADTVALCTSCHEEAALASNDAHPEPPFPPCTECHNPHLGSDRLLLNWDYAER